jgi:hypothetical protein
MLGPPPSFVIRLTLGRCGKWVLAAVLRTYRGRWAIMEPAAKARFAS